MVIVRRATVQDLPGCYAVCLLTGDAGSDASGQYRNADLLGHAYVGPYVVGQPDLALVVADPDGIAGYCLAALDTRSFETWAESAWWPPLRDQYPIRTDGSADADIITMFHAPPRAADTVVAMYPAHLHIDLLSRARGHGIGRELIERQMRSLRDAQAPGVHLEVDIHNENAIAFYGHLGFAEVERLDTAIVMGVRL